MESANLANLSGVPFRSSNQINTVMFDKILVPTDFSECAANALRFAVKFAKKANGKIVLLNAYHIPMPIAETTLAIDASLTENYIEETKERMNKLVASMPGLEEVLMDSKMEMAFVQDAIEAAAKKLKVDLIIMGTKGASNPIDTFFGSNTLHTVKKSSCPVLAIPDSAKEMKIDKLLFAYDYDILESQSSIAPVIDFARAFKAEVHILNVSESDEPLDHAKIRGAQILQHYLKNVPHFYHRVVNENVEDGIEEYVNEHEIDVIMVMARKHNFFDRVFHKSVTRELVYKSKMPLLAFHEYDFGHKI